MEERGELRQLRLQKMVNYLIGSGCAIKSCLSAEVQQWSQLKTANLNYFSMLAVIVW